MSADTVIEIIRFSDVTSGSELINSISVGIITTHLIGPEQRAGQTAGLSSHADVFGGSFLPACSQLSALSAGCG